MVPTGSGKRDYLCSMSELERTGAVGIERESVPHEIVVVAHEGMVRAYINSCPHKGTPLETFPDRFLDETKAYLICSTHGARFNIADGLCVFGPCRGDVLEPVKLEIREQKIYFDAAQHE